MDNKKDQSGEDNHVYAQNPHTPRDSSPPVIATLSKAPSEKEGASSRQSSISHASPRRNVISERESPITDSKYAGNDLSFRAVAPVDINICNLNVVINLKPSGFAAFSMSKKNQIKEKPLAKTILNDINAKMPIGSLTAIVGASGSGKSSLLNIMSQRISDSRLEKSGRVLYNANSDISSIRSAYVMQQDVLLPTLTVRETLRYAADLRLPPPTTAAERKAIVEEVILELGLKECADTRIGNSEHKGASGGEKRRTSLGVQLLSNPSVLFLDEVTTGLDATSAFQLIRTLKQLAQKGRTIITTIHQPRSEIWGLFDNLVLLTGGFPIYCGPTNICLQHFEKIGHPLPLFVNPAEFLIDLAAVDNRSPELEEASTARVEVLKEAWKNSSSIPLPPDDATETQNTKDSFSTTEETSPNVLKHSSFRRQVLVQTARTLKTTYRDPLGMLGSYIEAISLGLLTGWIFFGLSGSLSGIRSREGALYSATALQGYLVLLYETYRLSLDITVFDRERAEGVVGVLSFLVSRRLARVFLEDIPIPLVFSIIFYFMAGFRHVTEQFFVFFAVILLGQYIAVTLAMLCVAVARDFAGASLLANINFTLQSMGSGFFVQSNQIPVYVRWLKYCAYVWYGNGALCSNEFLAHTSDLAGHLYDCPYQGGTSNPACKEYTGAFIVDSLGFPSNNWIMRPMLVLLGFVLANYAAAAVLLQYFKVEMTISRARKPVIDQSAGKQQITSRSLDEVRTVDITLDKYSLDIKKHDMLGREKATLSILKPISTKFQPGVLNVILGPSGSGKTSLLNMMAGRLKSNFSTRYSSHGAMLYGGSVPSDNVIKSVTSYVCQDDDALLPTLTVRETLHFAAGLRLPMWMSKDEKKRRAEEILLKMGLRDCADNLIGNELVKGISGGEKRRVTIAMQVLTEPRILLLDEPTSGLDAFTASSIIEVLRNLAGEGKTLVLTIHQSRSDLFKHFGNILLLARGGFPVYAGKGDALLSYFSSLGHDCPQAANPADFALDLITVNLQHSTKEQISREKVQSLIVDWDKKNNEVDRTSSHIATPAELSSLQRAMTPFRIAFPLLVHRSFISFRRDSQAILARTTQVIALGVIITLFFAPLKSNYESVQTRLGYLQEFIALYFVGVLQNVAVYPNEKMVFYRENDDGAYSVESFFLQYTLLEIPFEIVASLVFAVLTVLAGGLPRTVTIFFVVFFNCFCIVNCGESIGIMFNTLFNHTGFAVNVTSVVLSIAILMAGVISLDISPVLQALNHLSPTKWAIGSMAPYTLRGLILTCNDAQLLPNGSCPITTGEQVLRLYNLDNNEQLWLLALGICTVAYRVVSYMLLKAKRTQWSWKAVQGKM